jgi:S1-C subfamily serine protease
MTAGSALDEIRETVTTAVEKVGPSAVGLGQGWHPGSGVVVSDGLILTNAHALRRKPLTVTFADGHQAEASVAGADPNLDLALLSADTAGVEPVDWPQEAPSIGIGSAVVALANPGGRGLRATLGFVSATDRSFRGPAGRRIEGCIEHTAQLPRGSSGGPLLSREGKLLGLNAIRLEGGLIVAVPTGAAARSRVDAMTRGESAAPVRLGVAVASPHVARRLRRSVGLADREGILVRRVQDSSPADRAGIERGDLIVAASGRQVDGIDALYRQLDSTAPDGSLGLTLVRGDEERTVKVEFGAAQAESEVAG